MKISAKIFSDKDVNRIAKLAHIPITTKEAVSLADGFTKTMTVVDHLFNIDVSQIKPTHQVTGLVNVFRKDIIDKNRMFTQEQALANAQKTKDGYIVVERVLEDTK